MRIVVAGLTAKYTATETADSLDAKGIGWGSGPSFVEIRGMRVFQVDVNEKDGRTYNANVSFSDKRRPRIAITPRLDISVMVKLALIASDLEDKPNVSVADELYRLTLDPTAGKTVVVEPLPGQPAKSPLEDDGPGALRVTDGKLTISATNAAKSITVNAGQCLISRDVGPNDHPIVGAIASGPCP